MYNCTGDKRPRFKTVDQNAWNKVDTEEIKEMKPDQKKYNRENGRPAMTWKPAMNDS